MKLATTSHHTLLGFLGKAMCLGLFCLSCPLYGAGPIVSNVTAQQRPDTKLVDISYDLVHEGDLASTVTIEATADGTTWTLLTELTSSGNHGYGVLEGTGKTVVWAAGDEWPALLFPAVKIRVKANDGTGEGVDLNKFSLVPAGRFVMGSPVGEPGRKTATALETQHLVTLSHSFYISKTEVTWSDYQSVHAYALSNGYTNFGAGSAGGSGTESGDHPVTTVSWWDAVLYCNALSEQEGKTPVYYTSADFNSESILRTNSGTVHANLEAGGYRLPTEAEWEYACRAGTTTAFYSGAITNPIGVDPSLDLAGWYDENSGDNTHSVASKAPNNWGIYDSHGNVWEWCWDLFILDLGSESVTDPTGGTSGSDRVIRGGTFGDPAGNSRSANRFRISSGGSYATLGFRVAVTSQ